MIKVILPNLVRTFRVGRNFSHKAAVNVEGMTDGVQRSLTARNLESLAKEGAQVLQKGGIIGVPTDTVYGLAADAQSLEAVKKLYEIKGRQSSKPIAICVADISDLDKWGQVTVAENVIHDFLPGPYTLVFNRQETLNPNLNPGTDLVGIRIPDNEFIRQLAAYHNGPVALTSANVSSDPSTIAASEFKHLWPLLDLVIDAGVIVEDNKEFKCRAGSTVIDLSQKNFYSIIREGSALVHAKEVLHKHGIRPLNYTS